MKRQLVEERPRWQERFEEMGFSFHSLDGLYWREGVCYEFTNPEIDALEEVTAELNRLCLAAVDQVIRQNHFSRLRIPAACEELIKRSWERRDPTLYGRFDLVYDGTGEAKLLEFNADTPTALFESSIAQWIWLEDLFPGHDQFNSIHEKLLAAFGSLKKSLDVAETMHFACVGDSEEDLVTVEYLRDVAIQTGIAGRHIFVEDIGYSPSPPSFRDLDEQRISTLFKLYPWEWLLADEFGQHLMAEPIRTIIEPAWKMVLANKGILAILWEMFPDHPNLLPASLSPLAGSTRSVRKPLFSREGANIAVLEGPRVIEETTGDYGAEGYVYQEYRELPRFADQYALIGSWVIGEQPAGIGIREDTTPITRNSSTFVPHFFVPQDAETK